MPTYKRNIQGEDNLFEKTVLQALSNVKDGSITVIKQDNTIIQVNILEKLQWNNSSETVIRTATV